MLAEVPREVGAVWTEETLDEIGASLERTPTKSIPKLAQQVEISSILHIEQQNY